MSRSSRRAKKSGRNARPSSRRRRTSRNTRPFFILVLIIVSVIVVGALIAQLAGGSFYVQEIEPQDVPAMVSNGAIIVDVRLHEDYVAGHIENSLWIPLEELELRMSELPTDRTIITVCRTGARSAQAFHILQEAGFPNIASLKGGMEAWVAAGYSLQTGEPVS
ncbi:MAG: rhodanese-like domain-containing protein [Anaerolineales bacterium]